MSNYTLCSSRTLERALSNLRGAHLKRPDGALAGHNVGTLVESSVGDVVASAMPGRVKRPHEVLNAVLGADLLVPKSQRRGLFGPESVQELLVAGRRVESWSEANPFRESQGATADYLLFKRPEISLEAGEFSLLDAKSVNLGAGGRAPNIISARKLFGSMWRALDEGSLEFDIHYGVVGYYDKGSHLLIEETRAVSLFSIASPLYINWTAGSQIQFNPFEVDQDFRGSRLEWCEMFLDHYLAEWDRETARGAAARGLAGKRVAAALIKLGKRQKLSH